MENTPLFPEEDELLIEQYLAGELTAQQYKKMQERMATDTEFAQYVRQHEALDRALKRQAQLKRFKQYDQELQQQNSAKRWKIVRYAAAATVAIGLGLVAYWQWHQKDTYSQLSQAKQAAKQLIIIEEQIIQPESRMGFAGTETVPNQIPVWLIAAPKDTSPAYFFGDTLQLFLPYSIEQLQDSAFVNTLQLSLIYDRTQNDTYFLNFKGKRYPLVRYNETPKKLE
ncbi:MAG: hypothetical protein RMJ44_08085 [Cytophagales bacterium]|nr:hypothetical protein [Bernardetiaceae bacterium]MDW8211032.1 hypothetical protein [Cytophagales bacterium]